MSTLTVNGRDYRLPERPVVVVCIDGSEPAHADAFVRCDAGGVDNSWLPV